MNRLLRWYRAITRRAEMVEIPRAQANPLEFEIITGPANPAWTVPLHYEDEVIPPRDLSHAEISRLLREGFGSGREPDVADLLMIDAERALSEGRFREAVLFCWGTIDSVFTRKYDALVATALTGEWAAARDFFTGIEVGMRNKMTGVLYLLCKRSLYRQPGDLWQRLTNSYTRRNLIIHRGENATEDEARQSLAVAGEVVQFMNSLAVQPPTDEAAPSPVKKPRKMSK